MLRYDTFISLPTSNKVKVSELAAMTISRPGEVASGVAELAARVVVQRQSVARVPIFSVLIIKRVL